MGTAIGRRFIGVASDRIGQFKVATGLTLLCAGVTLLFAVLDGAILGRVLDGTLTKQIMTESIT